MNATKLFAHGALAFVAVLIVSANVRVLPQSEVDFSLTCVSITPEGGFSDEHRFPGFTAS
jgi:hypothetical protein